MTELIIAYLLGFITFPVVLIVGSVLYSAYVQLKHQLALAKIGRAE